MKFVLTLCLTAGFVAALQAATVAPSTAAPTANDAPVADDVANDLMIPDICYLPREIGRCFGLFQRFTFNMNTKRCEKFVYGGCGGNANNFESQQACERICRPQSYDEVSDEESSTTAKADEDDERTDKMIPADEPVAA
ncbi:kunitz-type U15-theraphotoxin-Hs1g [Bactrocera dorsalis]|uniref:Kunitz-type U15-theraphotoxin-Hs1g n=1 Tax=Bactrocera dorsalis TaxID=27457 RepID=A0A6I9VP86_BACDO|nr:kunitz-type U15-theraphotoxin-Hs1g [Bactrocera dorsalis]